MEEKIRDEFNKDWSIDYTKDKLEKYERTLDIIKDLIKAGENKEDTLEEIKELIEELDYEING